MEWFIDALFFFGVDQLQFCNVTLFFPQYYIAKEQISVHEEFDEFLASGELDDYMDQFMSSKVTFAVQVEVSQCST